jgi:structural maintenance of chromosome 4
LRCSRVRFSGYLQDRYQTNVVMSLGNNTERIQAAKPNLAVLKEYRRREREFLERAQDLERITQARDAAKQTYDDLRKQRLDEFMTGFNVISMKLKEMYQVSRGCKREPVPWRLTMYRFAR